MSSEPQSPQDTSGVESNEQSDVVAATRDLKESLAVERRDASGARDIALSRAETLVEKLERTLERAS